MISIKVDIRGMDGIRRNLDRISDEVRRGQAIGAALNKTAQKAEAEATRAITERYQVKAGEVRNSVSLRSARAKSDVLEAVISIFGSPTKRGRSMNVIRFLAAAQAAGKATKTRGSRAKKAALAALGAQLGFQFLRGGGVKPIHGSFIGNKGRTIFRRVDRGRLPIEPVQVIGISQMFNQRAVRARVMAKINSELPIEVNRAVELILARQG